MKKATYKWITPQYLESRISKKYGKAKWIEFCEILLEKGYTCQLYEARQTCSKYIYVNGYYKVRFSNHKPRLSQQLKQDSDFYVGVGHLGTFTTEDAIKAVERNVLF